MTKLTPWQLSVLSDSFDQDSNGNALDISARTYQRKKTRIECRIIGWNDLFLQQNSTCHGPPIKPCVHSRSYIGGPMRWGINEDSVERVTRGTNEKGTNEFKQCTGGLMNGGRRGGCGAMKRVHQWDGRAMRWWDGGPMRLGTNEMWDQWDGGPVRWGTNELGGGTNEMGDQWDGGPMRWGTSEMGDHWDWLKMGGLMKRGSNENGDQWIQTMLWGDLYIGGPMRRGAVDGRPMSRGGGGGGGGGTNEMGD